MRCSRAGARLALSACRLRQAGRAVRYHRRRSAPASASPSRGPGNGILWAETGGRFQPQNAGERPEFGSQTATRLTNRPELRGFLPARKPRRFAGTGWWSQTESNRRPLQCHCDGPTFLKASPRQPRHASLTDRNCEGFCRPGNRVGLPVLYGGAREIRTVNLSPMVREFLEVQRPRQLAPSPIRDLLHRMLQPFLSPP